MSTQMVSSVWKDDHYNPVFYEVLLASQEPENPPWIQSPLQKPSPSEDQTEITPETLCSTDLFPQIMNHCQLVKVSSIISVHRRFQVKDWSGTLKLGNVKSSRPVPSKPGSHWVNPQSEANTQRFKIQLKKGTNGIECFNNKCSCNYIESGQ